MNANRLTATFLASASTALAISIATTCWAGEPANHAEDQDAKNADPVVASFDRDMQREAVPMAPAHGSAIAADQLYKALNPVHWTNTKKTVHEADPCAIRNAEPSLNEKDGISAETECAGNERTLRGGVSPAATVQ
jgi:hypothetical protein